MGLLEAGATPRTLAAINTKMRQTGVNSPQTVANRGPGGAPMKPSNGRRAPPNMTQGQTRKAMHELFNAAGAFGN